MPKPIVHFIGTAVLHGVGRGAYCCPVDHTSPDVSNTSVVKTSAVIRIGPGSEFETKNTIYRATERKDSV